VFGSGSAKTNWAVQKAEPLEERVLNAIGAQPGIDRGGLYKKLGGHVKKKELIGALAILQRRGLAHPKKQNSDGRPSQRWFLGSEGGYE
jgi:hypothetical protein